MAKKKYKILHGNRPMFYAVQLRGARNYLARKGIGRKNLDEMVWTRRFEKIKVFDSITAAEFDAHGCRVQGCDCEVVAVNFEPVVEDKGENDDDNEN